MTKDSNALYAIGQGDGIVELFRKRTVDNSAAYLKGSLEPHMRILDVGCGPGSITIDLARHVPLGHVTGVDTAAASDTLAKARAQAEKEGVRNVEFRVGDALALPFPDGTFDVVHAHQVLLHVDDAVGMLREMRRVAKPGGLVACRTYDTGTLLLYPPDARLDRLQAVFQRVMESWGRTTRAGRLAPVFARRAGFRPADIRVTSSNYTNHTPEDRRYWAGMSINVARESPLVKEALDKGFAAPEEIEAAIKGWEEWAANDEGLAIGMNIEILCRAATGAS